MDERPAWHPIQFVFIAFAITGSFAFKIPYYLYRYSVSVLLPYHFFLIGFFVPLIFIQLKLGGSIGSGVVGIFSKYSPILKGVGVALMIRLALFSLVEGVLIAQAIYYVYATSYSPYPWSSCSNSWNTPECLETPGRQTNISSFPGRRMRSPSEEFYWNQVIRLGSGMSPPGPVIPHLGGCLVGAWLFIFLIILAGRRWAGFTISILSAVNLVFVLAIMGYGWNNLESTIDFHWLYTAPSWKGLGTPDPWLNVFTTLVYLHTWGGSLPMMGKSLGRGKIITHTSWIFLFVVLLVAPHLYSNCIYPYQAALSENLGVSYAEVASSGPNMYFIQMPHSFSQLGVHKGIVVIFFLFVILQHTLSVCISALAIQDSIQGGLKKLMKNQIALSIIISMGYCGLGFLLSLLFVTGGGYYYFLAVDLWIDKMFGLTILLVGACYGIAIIRHKFHIVFKLLAAVLLAGITLISAGMMFGLVFRHGDAVLQSLYISGGTYNVPVWMKVLVWLLAFFPLVVGLVSGVLHMAITRQPFAGRPQDASAQDAYLVPANAEFHMGDMKPH